MFYFENNSTANNIIDIIQDDAGIILSNAECIYIQYLVGRLQEEGLWDKIKALYGFVGGTAATHRWNWKDMRDSNDAFRITWSGGITHSLMGVQGNGTDGIGVTHLNLISQGFTNKISVGSTFNLEGNGRAIIGSGAGNRVFVLIKNNFRMDVNGVSMTSYNSGASFSKSIFVSYDISGSPYISVDGNEFQITRSGVTGEGLPTSDLHILHRNGTVDYGTSRITSIVLGLEVSRIENIISNNIFTTAQKILNRA